jgi:hypothetical protein
MVRNEGVALKDKPIIQIKQARILKGHSGPIMSASYLHDCVKAQFLGLILSVQVAGICTSSPETNE